MGGRGGEEEEGCGCGWGLREGLGEGEGAEWAGEAEEVAVLVQVAGFGGDDGLVGRHPVAVGFDVVCGGGGGGLGDSLEGGESLVWDYGVGMDTGVGGRGNCGRRLLYCSTLR